MALKDVLHTTKSGPYPKPPPPLQFHVLLEEETTKVLSWTFRNNSAFPALTKKNKVVIITDGQSVAKVTLFEEISSRIAQGKNYVIRGYTLRGENPPYYICLNKDTSIYRSSPVTCRDGLMEEARALLHPPSLHVNLDHCHGHNSLLTVEGNIIELSTVKKIRRGKEEIPLRELKLQEGETCVSVTLWREAAIEKLEMDSYCRLTHLRACDGEGLPLQSTGFSKIEMITTTEEGEGVLVMGITETDTMGVMEIILESGRSYKLGEELWAPLDHQFNKGKLFVNLKIKNNKVQEICANEGGPTEE